MDPKLYALLRTSGWLPLRNVPEAFLGKRKKLASRMDTGFFYRDHSMDPTQLPMHVHTYRYRYIYIYVYMYTRTDIDRLESAT